MSELGEIAKALAAAQAEMANPGFDSSNPHFRSKFASLAAVRNAVVPVLAKHGVCLTQDVTTTDNGHISCRTILTHSSGQQMVFGPLLLPPSKGDAQGLGSAATYARRYSMMAVAGVVGDDDDDAEAAVGRGSGKSNSVAAAVAEVSGTSDGGRTRQDAEEAARLMREALELGIDGKIYEMHEELNTDKTFYIAVSALLTAGDRKAWKGAVERVQQSRRQ